MGDSSTYNFPVDLQWDLGPEKLKELKNKLLLYFQSKKKSNGGECVIKNMDCTEGHILIYFTQNSVRQAVLQKQEHELKVSGMTLKLNVRLPEELSTKCPAGSNRQDPLEDSQSRHGLLSPDHAEEPGHEADNVSLDLLDPMVLIEDIPDTCTLEMLSLLTENVSNKCENTDFHVEMIPEISAAVVTFTCDIDTTHFIGNFSSNFRVKQLNLKARPLEETKSIMIENLPPDTSEHHLIIYFESPKLGGATVQEAVMFPGDDAALVTFYEKGVVQTVLSKQHVFGKKRISVYPYYMSLGVALYGKTGPCITEPEPLEFPMSPYILEFILKDAQIQHNIDKEMADHYCEITWPNPDSTNPIIKLSISSAISTHQRTMVKIVRTWSDKVSAQFSLIISRYRAVEYKVNTSVWEAIKGEVSKSLYESFLIKPDISKERVILAGFSKDINKVEQTFRDLVGNTTRQIERQNQSLQILVTLSYTLYEIMCKNGLEKCIQETFPNVKMSYDVSAKAVALYGLKEEVYGSKCEILNMERSLRHKAIYPEPLTKKFLETLGNEDLSCLLFIRHNINAMFQIEGNSVTLTGLSMKDLSEAEEQMKRLIDCKHVRVEHSKIIQCTEWRTLKTHLLEAFNAPKCTVLIEEFPQGAEDQVVIAGLASNVQQSYQQIQDFLEKNTTIQKEIQVRSTAVLKFIMEEKKQICEEIKRNNVNVTMNHKKISLHGPKLYALKAANLLENTLSSLHSDTLHIDKPGAKKFCLKNEDVYVTAAKQKFNCVICLQKDGEDAFIAGEINLGKPHSQVTLPDGVTIAVYKDDLSSHGVDVVINASNEDLKHIGGLAFALLKAAGPKLQTDCDRIIREEGRLSPGESVITDASNLPCKQVIHTVGPRWDPSATSRCDRLLRKAITRSLELAAEKGHSSIGIPAVSSGIFGFPLQRCVENIVESIRNYLDEHRGRSSVKRFHLVDNNSKTVQVFTDVLRAEFRDQNTESTTQRPPNQVVTSDTLTRVSTNSTKEEMVATKEGLTVKIIQQNIQDAVTDVIVNSVSADLNLSNGGASKALLIRAGPRLQQLLTNENSGGQAAAGSMFVTDGCDLNCVKVLHVVAPNWDQGRGASEKALRKIICNCLWWSEQHRMQSISFPAIGTGNLGFPKAHVAAVMFDEISQFRGKNKQQNLQEVDFILHPSDQETIKEFTREFSIYSGMEPANERSTRTSSGQGSISFGTVTSPALGVHEMRIGSVTYQVTTGDITKEDTEVIVNSSNEKFNLRTGVSKAILDAAGQSVDSQCAQLESQPHKGYVVTDGGALSCDYILHVVGQTDPKLIRKTVLEALQECESLQVTSVAFPAIGTGVGNVPSGPVADAMLEAVEDFVRSKKAQMVQMVKVVIFQKQMLNDFYTSMKTKEGSTLSEPQSTFSKLTSWFLPTKRVPTQKLTAFQLMDNIEPAIIHLCAESGEIVKNTKVWLEKLIQEEQDENVLQEEWVADFEEQEQKKLSELQKRLQVSIEYKLSSIRISGLTRDVMKATKEVQEMIKQIRDKTAKEREAELFSNLVEWRYDNGAAMVPFDKLTNLQLEEAASQKTTQSFVISVKGKQLTVSMKHKSATDKHGNRVKMERVSKHEGPSLDLPSDWDPMGTNLVQVVTLNPGTSEYNNVQMKFAQSCKMRIHQIERIQNQPLWQNYQIKKQSLDTKNGSTNNEMLLFHGTDPNTTKNINHNGFNRSFAGKNAAAIGNGTYFAVNANYSAQDTYSRPDINGYKYMYLARVLTGVFCNGQYAMIAPPPINPSNPTNLYDSVTDNTTHPSMFVIFNDIQAYPEYLITFSQ